MWLLVRRLRESDAIIACGRVGKTRTGRSDALSLFPRTVHLADVGGAGVITHVLSLGSACFTARFMERHGLRRHAGPFDWVFSSPTMVEHCVADDFASFLDRSALVVNAGSDGALQCRRPGQSGASRSAVGRAEGK